MEEKKPTIIFTDDDEDDRFLFKMAIDSSNIDCDLVLFEGGHLLKQYVEHMDIENHIIFLDLNMPGTDGFACLEFIRERYTPEQLPVLIYTTSNTLPDREQSMLMGANNFIIKPSEFNELKSVIINAIKHYTSSEK